MMPNSLNIATLLAKISTPSHPKTPYTSNTLADISPS